MKSLIRFTSRSAWFSFITVVSLGFSLQVFAEPRYWKLDNVTFEDGTVATGYFSYDDATRTIGTWNVRVGDGWMPPVTYLPGNSWAGNNQFEFDFHSEPGGNAMGFDARWLAITVQSSNDPLKPLDGKAMVPVDTAALWSGEGVDRAPMSITFRRLTGGSVVLMALPPQVTVVSVDEFYNAVRRHYFLTADPAEKLDLFAENHVGWVRTGESFKAYAPGSLANGSVNPVCRYYGSPLRGLDSHFLSAETVECSRVPADWQFESDNVFQIDLPNKTTGECPTGTIPVFRLWNQRSDSNHRYTTSTAVKAQMLGAGFLAEGYGPDGVAMCALP